MLKELSPKGKMTHINLKPEVEKIVSIYLHKPKYAIRNLKEEKK